MSARALVVCRDVASSERLDLLLAEAGWRAQLASDAGGARTAAARGAFDLVLIGHDVAGLDDLDLVPQLARWLPDATRVLVAERPGPELAEEALHRGAHESLALPAQSPELALLLARCAARRDLRRLATVSARDAARSAGEPPIVAASRAMIDVLEALERAAGCDDPVLLCGEPGSGRENLARAIHAQSRRRSLPFVAVHCAAESRERLAQELFGDVGRRDAERPADPLLTLAAGGSLYLDRLDLLPAALEERLRDVLQSQTLETQGGSKPVPLDFRILSSCPSPADDDPTLPGVAGALASRRGALSIAVPPLRERREDIPLLVDHLLARFRLDLARPALTIGDEALERLTAYPWPGNLRELENVIERAVLAARGGVIGLSELPPEVVETPERAGGAAEEFSLRRARREAEAQAIRRALGATQGNRTHAARLLGVSHRALLYKLKEFRIG